MDWTQLRKLVEKKRRVKHSGRNGRPRFGRRLANQTYAYHYTSEVVDRTETHDVEAAERIEIELFEKPILDYYPDGSFEVNNHDYWTSPTTKDRFRQFLPGRGYISTWRFDTFVDPLQRRPAIRRVWSMSLIGGGCHPWQNEMRYNALGHRADLAPAVNEADANELLIKIKELSRQTIKELNEGSMCDVDDCAQCLEVCVKSQTEGGRYRKIPVQEHTLRHVLDGVPSLTMLRLSSQMFGTSETTRAVRLMEKENQFIWKEKLQRTNKAKAERIERLLSDPLLNTELYPTHYNRMLRWQLEKYLLTIFGFEIGSG